MHVGQGARHAVVVCCFPETPPLLAPLCSGDQIVGATIYFNNLQSGEVTQLLSTMGHHAVGLKLHRRGDCSPEPGQTWTHGVFSSQGSEVVLVSASPACPRPESPPPATPARACWPCPPSLPSACWAAALVLLSFLLLISPPLSVCWASLSVPLHVHHAADAAPKRLLQSLLSAAAWELTPAVWS